MVKVMAYLIYLFLAILLLPGGWIAAGPISESNIAMKPIFVTSDQCMACHNGLSTNSGEDVSIGVDWRTSMMANSARDPYWQASFRAEVLANPDYQEVIEDKCTTCHTPMARFTSSTSDVMGKAFGDGFFNAGHELHILALDGISYRGLEILP